MLGSGRMSVLFFRVLLWGSDTIPQALEGQRLSELDTTGILCLVRKGFNPVFPGTFVGFGYHSPSLGETMTERVGYH